MEGKSGRTIKGNLRNFGAMSDAKLRVVCRQLLRENNDLEAQLSASIALKKRDMVEGPPGSIFDPDPPKKTSTNTFTLGELLESHEQTLRFLLEEGLRRHRRVPGSGAALYRTYLRMGGRRFESSSPYGSWNSIIEGLESDEPLAEDINDYSKRWPEDVDIIVEGGEVD